MGDLAPIHWLLIPIGVAAVVTAIGRIGTRRTKLVLRSFDVRCRPRLPDDAVVEVVGRPVGIVAFVLTILGLEAQTKLRGTTTGVEYEYASLSGRLTKFIPGCRIASISTGLHKPIGYIIVAALFFLLGALSSLQTGSAIPIVLAIVISSLLLVGYFVSKSIIFEVTSNAGIEISLCFRPGVIEGVPVETKKALAAAGVIRDLILQLSLGSNQQAAVKPCDPETQQRLPADGEPGTCSVPPQFGEHANNGAENRDAADQEENARAALREAVRLYKAGNRNAAVAAMAKVQKDFPHTAIAAVAKENLAKIRSELTQATAS